MSRCTGCGEPLPVQAEFCPMCGTGSAESTWADRADYVPGLPPVGEDPWVGRILDHRYRLEERIGAGSMAFVYRATHTLIHRTQAVKVLRPELADDEGLVQRFVREARCASAVRHPNVVELSDYGQLGDGTAFYVMEFLRGRTLAQRIDAEGPLPAAEALDIALQICCGLEAIHAEGIVHRDLKSENVFLSQPLAGKLTAKVLDFGVARTRAKRMTVAGSVLGTPEYMSPEQALGDEVDARADIYSLGVVMFEMLTGLVPFSSPDIGVTLNSQIHGKAPLLRTVRPDRTMALVETERVIARMLAKDREERYPDASKAREAVQLALASDLGEEAEARVRATLTIGSNGVADSAPRLDPTPTPSDPSAQGPMMWRGAMSGDATTVTRRVAPQRLTWILVSAAFFSAIGGVGAYAVALHWGAWLPRPWRDAVSSDVAPAAAAHRAEVVDAPAPEPTPIPPRRPPRDASPAAAGAIADEAIADEADEAPAPSPVDPLPEPPRDRKRRAKRWTSRPEAAPRAPSAEVSPQVTADEPTSPPRAPAPERSEPTRPGDLRDPFAGN